MKTLVVDDIPNCSVSDRLILEFINDDEVELEQLSTVIEENPYLAAMIIGLANSAYYGAPATVFSVGDSIIKVLGMRMVRSVVLSVVLGQSLDVSRCLAFSVEDYWTDSLTAARYCQLLAKRTKLKKIVSSDQIYLCALLAGIGELVLIHHYPREISELIKSSDGDLDAYLQLQKENICFTQSEAGVLLGHRWQLPEIVLCTMQNCLDSEYRDQDWEICMIVGDVLRQTRLARQGREDLVFSETTEQILQQTSDALDLGQLSKLRSDLSSIAKCISSQG